MWEEGKTWVRKDNVATAVGIWSKGWIYGIEEEGTDEQNSKQYIHLVIKAT